MSEPLLDLLKQRDEEIIEVEGEIAKTQAALDRWVRTKADLVSERDVLAEMANRRGLTVPAPENPAEGPASDADWSNMTLVNAVERLLYSVAPEALHLNQIESGLHQRNRWNDKAESIPGTLAHLKRTRGTVVAVGGGRWAYNRAGTNAAGFQPASEVRDYPEFRDELAQAIQEGRGQPIGGNRLSGKDTR